jgi:hypothetical protein
VSARISNARPQRQISNALGWISNASQQRQDQQRQWDQQRQRRRGVSGDARAVGATRAEDQARASSHAPTSPRRAEARAAEQSRRNARPQRAAAWRQAVRLSSSSSACSGPNGELARRARETGSGADRDRDYRPGYEIGTTWRCSVRRTSTERRPARAVTRVPGVSAPDKRTPRPCAGGFSAGVRL